MGYRLCRKLYFHFQLPALSSTPVLNKFSAANMQSAMTMSHTRPALRLTRASAPARRPASAARRQFVVRADLGDKAQEAKEAVKDAAGDVKDNVKGAAGKTKEAAKDATGEAKGAAKDAKGSAKGAASEAEGKAKKAAN